MALLRLLKSSRCLLLCGLLFSSLNPVHAATLKDLRHQSPALLPTLGLLTTAAPGGKTQAGLREESRSVDFKHRLHIRLQETYAGYPVWGAQVLMHLPGTAQKQSMHNLLMAAPQASSMNGFVYQGLDADLQGAPAYIFEQARAEQALNKAIALHQEKTGRGQEVTEKQSRLVVYVDQKQKAHWTYFIEFKQEAQHGLPFKPAYLMDAVTLEVYRSWNNLHTREPRSDTFAGGFGGNPKMGRLIYDGLSGNYAALPIRRDNLTRNCYLENKDVIVKNVRIEDPRHKDQIEHFVCSTPDAQHNNLFWDGSMDAVNGAYSPSNDALFVGKVIKDLYQQWYGLSPLVTKEGKPMILVMRVHEDMENAYWDGKEMTFGDGGSYFYPLVSLGVGAHEISHGFTEQHSNLAYYGQSGGLNESFSDMAAQAAEYFATGTNSWQIGPEVMKTPNMALRYMDHPAKDCGQFGPDEEQCSIEHMKDYKEDLEVHFSSGIFNRVFYLIGSAPGWNTRKAFDLMVQANRHYWTPNTTFMEAACGVMDAVRDYGYPDKAVAAAFNTVGLGVNNC